uniref:Uncharacterized protein n=1 Tax=Leersia perrieri TaxID=77586 RepID=A0A0D9VGE4_9ORYZ
MRAKNKKIVYKMFINQLLNRDPDATIAYLTLLDRRLYLKNVWMDQGFFKQPEMGCPSFLVILMPPPTLFASPNIFDGDNNNNYSTYVKRWIIHALQKQARILKDRNKE